MDVPCDGDRKVVVHHRNTVVRNREMVACNRKPVICSQKMVMPNRQPVIGKRKGVVSKRKPGIGHREMVARNRKSVIDNRKCPEKHPRACPAPAGRVTWPRFPRDNRHSSETLVFPCSHCAWY